MDRESEGRRDSVPRGAIRQVERLEEVMLCAR